MAEISLSQAVQVITDRPCTGEQRGYATSDFCNAISVITGSESPELLQGSAGALCLEGSKAQSILADQHPDIVKAVTDEIDFEGLQPEQAVVAIHNWVQKNHGKFGRHLAV